MLPQFEPRLTPRHADAVAAQVRSGWVGCGERVREFEDALRRQSGAKHVLATTSGTTALVLALAALDLRGLPVAFPAYTFLAGANAARFLGSAVRLVDVAPGTLCMDAERLAECGDLGAVLFVNHNAYVGEEVARVRRFCDARGIPMIEDASQALGLAAAGRSGDAGVFSFSVPKLLTTGQGGALLTDDDGIAERVARLRDHGDGSWRSDRTHHHLGVNFRFNDVLAALGLAQLDELNELLAMRRTVWNWYSERIEIYRYHQDSTWMVIHRTPHADRLIAALAEDGITALKYYRPVHHNPPYAGATGFPVSEALAQELVYLPSSLSLTEAQVEHVCRVVRSMS